MAMWNCMLLEHNRAPMGTAWSQVHALGPDNAVKAYCKDQGDLWKPGDIGRVQTMEDGFVGEPRDFDVRMRLNGTFSVNLDE